MSAPGPLRIHLLGGFRVAVGSREIEPSAWRLRTASTLVKLLALAPAHSLHREHIMDTLWPDVDPAAMGNNVRYTLHTARRILQSTSEGSPAYLQRSGDQIILGSPDAIWTDVEAFKDAVNRAGLSDDPELYRHAVDLYCGDLLPEDRYEEWAENRRIALLANFVTTLSRLAELYERHRDPNQAIEILQRLVLVEPTDEAAHGALMRLYSRMGRRAEALAQYDRLTAILEREFNVEPEAATRELARDIRNERNSAGQPHGHVGVAADPIRSNLPARLTVVIGREREIAEVKGLLTTKRLVTLIGPGGVGKTRLGEAIAGNLVPDFRDGVYVVWLAAVLDAELVVPMIAQTLGAPERDGQSPFESLVTLLQTRSLLLMLDNFEQVVEAAPMVSELLLRCPDVRVLATSRIRLHLQGEQRFPVGPLELPDVSSVSNAAGLSQFGSVMLFGERAREVAPHFCITDDNAATIAAICQRLEGLPLAIELAAARVDLLSPDALFERLEQRLPLLTDGPRDPMARQRSVRSTIAWSYDLLDPPEQLLFRQLSAFTGGWTLDAADYVAGYPASSDQVVNVMTGLRTLVDHNLVQQTEQSNGIVRSEMLETIREYGLEQLEQHGEMEETFRRHALYFLALAQEAEPNLYSAQSTTYINRLDEESANLRAVIVRENGRIAVDAALLLAAALWRFWLRRSHFSDGQRLLQTALARASAASPRARAAALHALARLTCETGDYEKAISPALESLRISRSDGDQRGIASALMILGYIETQQQRYEEATVRLEEALAIDREIGREIGIIEDLNTLALVASHEGRHEQAETFYAEMLRLLRDRGDLYSISNALNNIGAEAWIRGDLERASALLEESLALARQLQYSTTVVSRLVNLGHVALDQGNLVLAAERYSDDLRLDDSEQKGLLVEAFEGFAAVAGGLKQPLAAARLFGAAEALRDLMGMPIPPSEQLRYERYVASGRAQTSDAAWASAWEKGRSTP